MRPTPPDQLSLELASSPARLPSDLRPMLPKPADAPFDDPDWLFEPSWEGRRVLAHIEDARLRLVDARGRDLASRFPDLLGIIDAITSPPAVLDGEVVVPDAAGMPDAEALQSRLRPDAGDGTRGRRARATYLVDDVLVHGGRPLLGEPLERRRSWLTSLLRQSEHMVVVPALAAEGSMLFEAVERQGLPAMLARRRDSPYLSGMRSDLWRSIRTTRRFEAVVGGYASRPDGRLDLLIGAWERPPDGEERFVAVGAVDAAAGSELAATLERVLRRIEEPATPFRRGARAEYHWVRPELVVTVGHRGWSDGRLVAPNLVLIRDELEARGCRVPGAIPAEGDAAAGIHRPLLALMQRLPLGED